MQGQNNNTRQKRATQSKSEQQQCKEGVNNSNARRATCSNTRQGEEKAEAMQGKTKHNKRKQILKKKH
jgi:hypothetical protein